MEAEIRRLEGDVRKKDVEIRALDREIERLRNQKPSKAEVTLTPPPPPHNSIFNNIHPNWRRLRRLVTTGSGVKSMSERLIRWMIGR